MQIEGKQGEGGTKANTFQQGESEGTEKKIQEGQEVNNGENETFS